MRIIRVALAVTVALWMAGAGCLLGCEGSMASAASAPPEESNVPTIIASGEVCAAQARDCCARHTSAHASQAPKVAPQPRATTATSRKVSAQSDIAAISLAGLSLTTVPSTMDSCPLAVNATAVLSKIGREQSSSALPVTQPEVPLVSSQLQAIDLPPLQLPNRGHTYLRCCVFLI